MSLAVRAQGEGEGRGSGNVTEFSAKDGVEASNAPHLQIMLKCGLPH